jgi:hypothetical protein
MLPGFYEMLRCVTIVPTPRLEGEKKKEATVSRRDTPRFLFR